jgi:hypothetical protein
MIHAEHGINIDRYGKNNFETDLESMELLANGPPSLRSIGRRNKHVQLVDDESYVFAFALQFVH